MLPAPVLLSPVVSKDGAIDYVGKKAPHCFSWAAFDERVVSPFSAYFEGRGERAYAARFRRSCEHMFRNVGFGIFVYVHEGGLHTVQPFANNTETTPALEGLTAAQIDEYYSTRFGVWEVIGRTVAGAKLRVEDRHKWVMDQKCFLVYWAEWWMRFARTLTNSYIDMVSDVCRRNDKRRRYRDACFFLNVFDVPQIKRGSGLLPVFSACTTPQHDDICLIYPDAWSIMSGKTFMTSKGEARTWYKNPRTETVWSRKERKIVFRGANTSCWPNDPVKNTRLRVLALFHQGRLKEDVEALGVAVDVGLSRATVQTHYVDGRLDKSDAKALQKLVGPMRPAMSMNDQSACRYILDIDGYATPWRLFFELSYRSVIILVTSEYTSWFYDRLEDGHNIFLVDRNDPDLRGRIRGIVARCEADPAMARRVGANAGKLFRELKAPSHSFEFMSGVIRDHAEIRWKRASP
jgi:hypothetical protein